MGACPFSAQDHAQSATPLTRKLSLKRRTGRAASSGEGIPCSVGAAVCGGLYAAEGNRDRRETKIGARNAETEGSGEGTETGESILKITFSEQAIKEAEKRQAERNRAAQQQQTSATSVGQTAFAAMFVRQQDGILEAGGEKGKSLIELQQEAANADGGVQREYMTVMSHTM